MSPWSNFRVAMAFLMPAILCVMLLRLWPTVIAVHQSLLAPRATSYSLENYIYIFTDPLFQNSVWVTLLFSFFVNPLQIAIALALAILLNNKLPMTGFWRTAILLPVAIPQSVSAVIWAVIYRPDGLLNSLLAVFGIEPQRFVTSPEQALWSIMVVVSWIGVGYWMTMLIAGLQDIPKSLYEAATIDGANGWQKFWYGPCRRCAGR
ncbi:carbohydrate ABC transporter permease [Devosia sediminis]|uniref:Sugar ABC transporter permease n=1 Tax=Devosia sediminis TaxID=2798801 RepID=A0A934J2A1_9HYPH|nr:sugar ABC transporter permease [Devosia sediminis]MBJ3786928.1 sugar ABC transporter permease [Devosia sediminis]